MHVEKGIKKIIIISRNPYLVTQREAWKIQSLGLRKLFGQQYKKWREQTVKTRNVDLPVIKPDA